MMTTLVAWVGIDQRGTASIYLGSDSRISWSEGRIWDHGRKLFSSKSGPHLLGYCGDVIFPTQTLGQIVEMIDRGLLVEQSDKPDVLLDRIIEVLTESLGSYPVRIAKGSSVLYATRTGNGTDCSFHLYEICFGNLGGPSVNRIEFPVSSGIMAVLGSGRAAFQASYDRWQHSDAAGTSRAVFSALGDAMRAGVDPNTGGPPQLVGLYRIGSGRTFGIIWEGKRYFYGTEVKHAARFETVNWHNELFEIGDPGSLGRRIDSQPQPRPNSLK